jgi:hypothetical protein
MADSRQQDLSQVSEEDLAPRDEQAAELQGGRTATEDALIRAHEATAGAAVAGRRVAERGKVKPVRPGKPSDAPGAVPGKRG